MKDESRERHLWFILHPSSFILPKKRRPDVFVHEKVMFEIYREAGYDRRYRVVYFTELDEHNKDQEIARAVAGEHYYDGFFRADALEDAKRVVGDILEQLNRGELIAADEAARRLSSYES